MAGIKEEKKIYLVGIYCRLSKDDGTDNESASIATQKSILTDYVKKQGWHIAKTYVDDGYSGTNFQRPSFQNMIKDIESGLINCVITKDLSRLGRNYLDCGLYLEVFFPEHNVRYIAVNDGVDTLNKSAMDITPFRNILNEMYAADISVKIKSAYRARFQQGKFMGTTAPYGYIKDPADHNHLLIDDKVAHVVKEIFDLALKGNGVAKICRHLNKQHIQNILHLKRVLEFVGTVPFQEINMKKLQDRLEKKKQETERCKELRMMLYSDMKEGIVSKEDYVELHAAYGKRLRNAEESIRAIQKEMDSELEKADNANTWLDYFVKYQDIEELSRTVVVELIRKIRVYDKKNIEITFDFDDCYQTLLNQLPAMGVDTVIDDDNNLQVKVKEVV